MHTTTCSAFQATCAPGVCLSEIVSHRGYLVRFAQPKLRDPNLAEDAVHDVFEAVISGHAAFGGRAAPARDRETTHRSGMQDAGHR